MEIDSIAPDFSLFNSDKQKISLHDFKGKNVVILFFPLAFTNVCTAELCSVRDNLTAYDNKNAEVLGISVDSVYTLARYKDENQINFTLLSDFNKTVSKNYNSLYETFGFEMKGVSKRSAFVIDKEGKIRYSEILENASEIPDFEKINQILAEL